MANGTTDIVDTLDNTALRLIQEAQNLAAANNNVSLAAALATAAGVASSTQATQGSQTTSKFVREGEGPGTVAPPPGTGTDPGCPNPTYSIRNITEIRSPIGGPRSSIQNRDFANLQPGGCILVAEIIRCCGGLFEESLGYIQIGEAEYEYYYEPCPDTYRNGQYYGGYIPVIKSYYDIDNKISPTGFVNPITGQSVAGDLPTGPWSPNVCDFSQQTTYITYADFKTYLSNIIFNPNFNSGTPGLNLSSGFRPITTRTLKEAISNGQNNITNLKPRLIEASCETKGNCITKGDPPSPPPPPPPPPSCENAPQWPVADNFVFEVDTFGEALSSRALVIPNGWRPFSQFTLNDSSNVFSTSDSFEPIPGEPCAVGRRRVTRRIQDIVYTYTYTVDNKLCDTKDYIERITTDTVEYIDRGLNTENPECRCQEILDYGDTIGILDTKDSCKCTQYNLVKVRTKCPGETEYTDSSNFYFEGIPDYLHSNVPAGYKLDPLTPIVTRGDCVDEKIKIYHPLVLGKDVITGKVTGNTRGLFNLAPSMSCYNTSSLQSSASKEYYYDVADCDCDSTPYFAVAFGHVNGSGSLSSQGETNDTATRAIYSQYRLLALESPETRFRFFNSGAENTPDYIYVINFKRDALSDRIDPGNFEIPLIPLSGGAPSGSTVYTFIDNSDDKSELSFCSEDPYVSYDIVSGSLKNGIHSSGTGTTKTTYGKFYPNLGFIVFDGEKVESLVGFETVTGSNVAGDNAYKLFLSISGSSTVNDEDGNLYHIKGRNVKYKTTNHYFVRVSAPNANYSNNPTYVTGSGTGQIQNTCFQKEPVTYVTSVGLYNDRRELLAVAKLSRPVKKTPDDDLLIKIRLNW